MTCIAAVRTDLKTAIVLLSFLTRTPSYDGL